jgi:hypothetical protein
MARAMERRADGTFVPGSGGCLPGRKARAWITNKFLSDLAAEWEVSGRDAMKILAKEHPDKFVMVAAALVPKQVEVDVSNLSDATDAELQAFLDNRRALQAKLVAQIPMIDDGREREDELR